MKRQCFKGKRAYATHKDAMSALYGLAKHGAYLPALHIYTCKEGHYHVGHVLKYKDRSR